MAGARAPAPGPAAALHVDAAEPAIDPAEPHAIGLAAEHVAARIGQRDRADRHARSARIRREREVMSAGDALDNSLARSKNHESAM